MSLKIALGGQSSGPYMHSTGHLRNTVLMGSAWKRPGTSSVHQSTNLSFHQQGYVSWYLRKTKKNQFEYVRMKETGLSNMDSQQCMPVGLHLLWEFGRHSPAPQSQVRHIAKLCERRQIIQNIKHASDSQSRLKSHLLRAGQQSQCTPFVC